VAKKTGCCTQTRKSQNLIDANSKPTHVSESEQQTLQVTREPASNTGVFAVTYYGFYLFAIALVVIVGQLAFALYQAASLVLS
jgi:hypothetical protein